MSVQCVAGVAGFGHLNEYTGAVQFVDERCAHHWIAFAQNSTGPISWRILIGPHHENEMSSYCKRRIGLRKLCLSMQHKSWACFGRLPAQYDTESEQ